MCLGIKRLFDELFDAYLVEKGHGVLGDADWKLEWALIAILMSSL